MLESLMAIKVEQHQCPSHQSILLTQGPIHEILAEFAQLLTKLKNSVFLSRPFWFFFQNKKKKICFIPMKISHKLCVRMDALEGTQFSLLWWFTAKNKGGNHKWAWVYDLLKNMKCRVRISKWLQLLSPVKEI